jgi:tetratricopeptide (TPR) repeat protein
VAFDGATSLERARWRLRLGRFRGAVQDVQRATVAGLAVPADLRPLYAAALVAVGDEALVRATAQPARPLGVSVGEWLRGASAPKTADVYYDEARRVAGATPLLELRRRLAAALRSTGYLVDGRASCAGRASDGPAPTAQQLALLARRFDELGSVALARRCDVAVLARGPLEPSLLLELLDRALRTVRSEGTGAVGSLRRQLVARIEAATEPALVVEACRRAVALEAPEAGPVCRRARQLAQRDERALALYLEAARGDGLALDPVLLARALASDGPSDVLESVELGAAVDPLLASEVWNGLSPLHQARVLRWRGRDDEARAALTRAQQELVGTGAGRPDDLAAARWGLATGDECWAQGDEECARRLWSLAPSSYPFTERLWPALARAARLVGDAKGELEVLRAAVQGADGAAAARLVAIVAWLRRRGDLPLALELLAPGSAEAVAKLRRPLQRSFGAWLRRVGVSDVGQVARERVSMWSRAVGQDRWEAQQLEAREMAPAAGAAAPRGPAGPRTVAPCPGPMELTAPVVAEAIAAATTPGRLQAIAALERYAGSVASRSCRSPVALTALRRIGAADAAERVVEAWVREEPDELAALRSAVEVALAAGRFERAKLHTEALLYWSPSPGDELTTLAAGWERAGQRSRGCAARAEALRWGGSPYGGAPRTAPEAEARASPWTDAPLEPSGSSSIRARRLAVAHCLLEDSSEAHRAAGRALLRSLAGPDATGATRDEFRARTAAEVALRAGDPELARALAAVVGPSLVNAQALLQLGRNAEAQDEAARVERARRGSPHIVAELGEFYGMLAAPAATMEPSATAEVGGPGSRGVTSAPGAPEVPASARAAAAGRARRLVSLAVALAPDDGAVLAARQRLWRRLGDVAQASAEADLRALTRSP